MSSVPRFYVPNLALAAPGQEVVLPAHVARQATVVLRMVGGDPLVLFDGAGGEWQAVLRRAGRDGATATLQEFSALDREAILDVTLALALLKADKFEWVLQKGTELGVVRFVPVLCERVVGAGRHSDRSVAKRERWERIVIEAAEQSGRTRVPAIAAPTTLGEAVALPGQSLLCWEEEHRSSFVEAIAERVAQGERQFAVLIGPEGGFTAAEVQQAARAGVQVCSLGSRTLRSETAAVAALSLALLRGNGGPTLETRGKNAAALPLAAESR